MSALFISGSFDPEGSSIWARANDALSGVFASTSRMKLAMAGADDKGVSGEVGAIASGQAVLVVAVVVVVVAG